MSCLSVSNSMKKGQKRARMGLEKSPENFKVSSKTRRQKTNKSFTSVRTLHDMINVMDKNSHSNDLPSSEENQCEVSQKKRKVVESEITPESATNAKSENEKRVEDTNNENGENVVTTTPSIVTSSGTKCEDLVTDLLT